MKKILSALLLLLAVYLSQAQTKVFKEISDEISSQVKAIRQDNVLVGYVVFTQLEKASADSFNYKLTIMDENLNDIGNISFKDQQLSLKTVSFEQDVLALGYIKNTVSRSESKNKRDRTITTTSNQASVFVQFVSLQGKILNTSNFNVQLSRDSYYTRYGIIYSPWYLKHSIQLSNIPQKGFACFYGEDQKSYLLFFNPNGNIGWKKTLENAEAYTILASKQDVYVLLKKNEKMVEGGYELIGYNVNDSSLYPKHILKDKQGNSLKALSFENDPVTGKPYISGYIINPSKGNKFLRVKHFGRGPYSGVFTINIKGDKLADIQSNYAYWADGSQSFMNTKGHFTENNTFPRFETSFKDYQGNTFFVGSALTRKPRWGMIIPGVITMPLVIPPIYFFGGGGSVNGKTTQAVVLKQNPKGAISVEQFIPANTIRIKNGLHPITDYDTRDYYLATNSDTKTEYIIIDDAKDISIYNVNQKKVARTIPHKDGKVYTYVFPAKEGHIMISEYNKKERYTRVSIEAL